MYLIKTNILQSPIEGKGYFANEDVSRGTIVYLYGEKDKRFCKKDFEKLDDKQKQRLLEFAVEDEFGSWVETFTGPFTNHSCDPNIMPLFIGGNYTNIAVKDIKIGDEITVDYSQFFSSSKWTMTCKCGTEKCRKIIGFGLESDSEIENFWQSRLNTALEIFQKVPQPIFMSKDKYAKEISRLLKLLNKPVLSKYVKFSLIDSDV